MARLARCFLCMCLFAAAIVAIGCSKETSSAAKPTTGGPGGPGGPGAGGPGGPGGGGPGGAAAKPLEETGAFAAGKKVYNAQDCSKCHSIDPNAGRGKAPSLATEGKEHDAAWIAAHIKNPKTHSPMSRMPSYEGKISDADLKSLSEFLASLK